METTWLRDAVRRPRHVAVGKFDGVHLGHREVIRGADTVLTFEPHPRAVVTPDGAPPLLTPLAVKRDLIAGLGVRELVVAPFDSAFAAMDPQEFVDDVLVDRLGAHTVSVGENFRFGHRARGDTALLRRQSAFTTRVASMVALDEAPVSSSHIRELVAAGAVGDAAVLLGDYFEVRGTVVAGERRGRTLGYPTANLEPGPGLLTPAHGVYACSAGLLEGETWRWRPAATSIGLRPTFQTALGELIEAHLIDFSGDLYGRELRLRFVARLRGEERFDSADALVAQMHADVEHARTRLVAAGQ